MGGLRGAPARCAERTVRMAGCTRSLGLDLGLPSSAMLKWCTLLAPSLSALDSLIPAGIASRGISRGGRARGGVVGGWPWFELNDAMPVASWHASRPAAAVADGMAARQLD